MILILVGLLTIVGARTSPWEQSCRACSLDSATCRMEFLADRQMAEISLKSMPEVNNLLEGCGGVDILHINFNWNNVDSKLVMDDFEVDTLIFSDVSSVLPGALSGITRSNANSILFCNAREIGREIPNTGRIGFAGPLDKSLAKLFPRNSSPEGSMIIKFEPNFSGLIDSLNPEITSGIDFLLLEVTSVDQFMLLTEAMTKSSRKPIINAIIHMDDEEDMLTTTEFMQRLALLASAVEIRNTGMQPFTTETMPRRLLVNLIRFMFVTYHHIRNLPGASHLNIFFQADYILKTKLSKNDGLSSKPYGNGFRCEINIEKLFLQYKTEMMKRALQRQTSFEGSFRSGSVASTLSVKSWDSSRVPRTDPSLQRSFRRPNQESSSSQIKDAVPSASITSRSPDVQKRPYQAQQATVPDGHKLKDETTGETIGEPKSERCEEQHVEDGDCHLSVNGPNDSNRGVLCDQHEQFAPDSCNSYGMDSKGHSGTGDDQAVPLAKLKHPDELASVQDGSSPKSALLDSPIVMISVIVGSVVVLTIAIAVICISSKRRRLKRSVKLQTPTTSKNETDPETLWW